MCNSGGWSFRGVFDMKLPEMSVIDTHLPSNHKTRGYTVEQMLAWGKACAAAEREECARLCQEIMQEHNPFDRQAGVARRCLDDIRARGTT